MAGPVISGISVLTPSVEKYGLVEIRCTISGTYTNVFDYNEIKLDGNFTAPDSSVLVQPGFWYQNYTVTGRSNTHGETYGASGAPEWRVRFMPNQVGIYTFTLTATNAGGATTSTSGNFTVTTTAKHISPWRIVNKQFRYDDGQWFAPIGRNYAFEDRNYTLDGTAGR